MQTIMTMIRIMMRPTNGGAAVTTKTTIGDASREKGRKGPKRKRKGFQSVPGNKKVQASEAATA